MTIITKNHVCAFTFPVMLLFACAKPVFKSKWLKERAPEKFTARFETSKGGFDMEIVRNYSPAAVDRVYQQLKHHFYDRAIFYRADSNFVVQFGTSDTVKYSRWTKYKVPDERVVYGNKKGTISFAREGKETRGTDLFINLKTNASLDTVTFNEVKGFPAFGNVTRSFEVVESIYTGYGDNTLKLFDTMYLNRAVFLQRFPKLDTVKRAYILR